MKTADRELTMSMMTTMIAKTLIAAKSNNTAGAPITDGQLNTGKRLRQRHASIQRLYDTIVAMDRAEKTGISPEKLDTFIMTLVAYCEDVLADEVSLYGL